MSDELLKSLKSCLKCGLKYDENQIRLFLCFNCTEEEMESHNTCPHLHLLLDIQRITDSLQYLKRLQASSFKKIAGKKKSKIDVCRICFPEVVMVLG